MKKFLLTLLFFSDLAFGAADWLTPNGMTQVMNGVDDGTYHVSLGHAFPYYGGVFTDAWMSSNGVIILYDPTTSYGNPSTGNSFCCSGYDFSAQTNNNSFSFILAPLWTDLRDANLTPDDGYYYQTDKGGSSFLWYNVTEFGTTNTNTFQANLWPDGSFDFLYDEVDVVQHTTTIGFSGSTTFGEYETMYHGNNISDANLGGMNWWSQSFPGQGYAWYGQDGGYKSTLDCSDALNDSRCPGYAEAYFDQQCSFDALYSTQCSGYEAAYFTQQCDYDPFYDSACPGYDQAILLQDMSGTDFIYGDDITDFYDTEPVIEEEMFVAYGDTSMDMFQDEDYGYTEDTVFEDSGVYEEVTIETFDDDGDIFSEEFGEVYTESFDDPLVEEIFDEPVIVEEEIIMEEELYADDSFIEEDEYIEEEIAHIEEEMSNIEEELLMSEEVVTVSGPSINAVSIALNTASTAEANAVQVAEQAQSNISVAIAHESENNRSEASSQSSVSSFTFGSVDELFGDATMEMMIDPTMMVAEINVSIDSPTEQAIQEEDTIDFQMESTAPQMDTGFAEQQNQSFSTGQSITAVLNNVAPNFSRFDVAPPSQQEQKQTARAEAAANNMSQEDIEASMESMSGDMQDSGGFTDQSLTIFLMGRVSGFESYGARLQDKPFYRDRGMPGGNVQSDRNAMLRMMGTDNKHEEMVAGQYR